MTRPTVRRQFVAAAGPLATTALPDCADTTAASGGSTDETIESDAKDDGEEMNRPGTTDGR